jgi:DNA-binding HxlR family transcriptional regulator
LSANNCATGGSLDVIGDWRSLLIIRDARSGRWRFSEFQRNLRMAKNILATRLKKLVQRGTMEFAPASDGSAFKEHLLTDRGEKLLVVIVTLWQWREETCFERDELCFTMVHAGTARDACRLKVQTGKLTSIPIDS